ncbi:MAG TPA: hypothetical protein ENK60_00115 [Anaerolineae bacterium]|nr:hypothetical protein [Anaerolineae bacterium]
MILIINGPLGVGKTTVAEALLQRFPRGVMLDGDAIGHVHPFEIYDPNRTDYLYRTLAMLVAWHQREGGYEHFVINYVFEKPDSLARLLARLRPLDPDIRVFRLRASPETLRARIRKRGSENDAYHAWELERGPELLRIQDAQGPDDALGEVIETDGLSVEEVTEAIWARVAGNTNAVQ